MAVRYRYLLSIPRDSTIPPVRYVKATPSPKKNLKPNKDDFFEIDYATLAQPHHDSFMKRIEHVNVSSTENGLSPPNCDFFDRFQ